MNEFSSHWLSLREPLDHAARNTDILGAVRHYFDNRKTLAITDIAGGTGSTLRALGGKLDSTIKWHLLDNDPALLAHAEQNFSQSRITTQLGDLSASIETVLEKQPDLITTSAFLDLVSETWLREFAALLAKNDLPFYAAITYNGQKSVEPSHPLDARVAELFDAHQQTDKGFGPAMGPASADLAIGIFREAGYVVTCGASDWLANDAQPEFQQELLTGWHQAALELSPDTASELDDWLAFRVQKIRSASSRLVVGHTDFFARPG